MLPGPSFILVHPTVWPQYTNVTDRQTDRQRSDSIGRTVLQTVAQENKLGKMRIFIHSNIRMILPIKNRTSADPQIRILSLPPASERNRSQCPQKSSRTLHDRPRAPCVHNITI